MSDDKLKAAVRELREDLDRLRTDLENEIAGIVGIDECADDIITEEGGSISVDVAELKALFERLDDAPGEADSAFTKFHQEVDRAWRRFRQVLVQIQEGASA